MISRMLITFQCEATNCSRQTEFELHDPEECIENDVAKKLREEGWHVDEFGSGICPTHYRELQQKEWREQLRSRRFRDEVV